MGVSTGSGPHGASLLYRGSGEVRGGLGYVELGVVASLSRLVQGCGLGCAGGWDVWCSALYVVGGSVVVVVGGGNYGCLSESLRWLIWVEQADGRGFNEVDVCDVENCGPQDASAAVIVPRQGAVLGNSHASRCVVVPRPIGDHTQGVLSCKL